MSAALPEESIQVRAIALDWMHATELAVKLLVAAGKVSPQYGAECLSVLEGLGPYQVIAPGIALIHSKPSPSVFETGISMLTLSEGVEFGHQSNDPVRILIGLAALDHHSHIEIMGELARFLQDEANVNFLLNVASAEEISAYLQSNL